MPQSEYRKENRENNRTDRNNSYDNSRKNQYRDVDKKEEETKKEVVTPQNRDITVELKSNTAKTKSLIKEKGPVTIASLKISLAEVNNMLVEFYDAQLNAFGAQGLKDKDGNPYNAANYSTPEEKLTALEAITHYNLERNAEFTSAHKERIEEIKNKKALLKEKAEKILNTQKEAIEYNFELIKEAREYIHKKELESAEINTKKTETRAKVDALNNDKASYETQKADIQSKLDKLNAERKELQEKINEIREKELNQGNANNGKQRNNQNAGYYTAMSQQLRGLSDQITEQERNLTTINEKISICDHDIAELENGVLKSLDEKGRALESEIEGNNKRLKELETSTGKLVSKHDKDIDTLNDAFKEKVKGLVEDDIKLNYSDKKADEAKEKEELEAKSETPSNDDKTQANNSTATTTSTNMPVPSDASNLEYANTLVDNLKRTSAEKIRWMINGEGYSDMIDAMDAADVLHKKDLMAIIENVQNDFELPDYNEFLDCIKDFAPKKINPDDVYDCLFNGGKINNFNSLNKKQIDMLQYVMDGYLKAKLKLSGDQLESFEKNFAQFVKTGALLQRGSRLAFNNGIRGIFNNIFNRSLNASRNRLLYTMSDYTAARFKDLNATLKRKDEFKKDLGKKVEDYSEIPPTRGDVRKRDLKSN